MSNIYGEPQDRSHKGEFPFKVALTSLTFPDAPFIENISRIVKKTAKEAIWASISAIELTLDYPGSYPLDPQTIAVLLEMKSQAQIDYTVHLPLTISLSSSNPHIVDASVRTIAEVYKDAEQLDPIAYVLHITPLFPPGSGPASRPTFPYLFELQQFERALKTAEDALVALKSYVDPSKIAVENLPYTDLRDLQPFLIRQGYSRCLDVGHVLLGGADPLMEFRRLHSCIKILHLHDVIDGRDHHNLGSPEGMLNLKGLLNLMLYHEYQNVITIELFTAAEIDMSLQALTKTWQAVITKQ